MIKFIYMHYIALQTHILRITPLSIIAGARKVNDDGDENDVRNSNNQ